MCTVLGKDSATRSAMRVGADLKAARKKAGVTIEVISKRTKIQASKLVALEKNDFKQLPTGLYLFSVVRAYAREVHIDPEPIVQRLRAEFAEKDALDALHALDATGALDAKGSRQEQSTLLRNAAIAVGVVLTAAAGAGAGVYLHNRSSNEAALAMRPAAVPATTVATAVEAMPPAAPATEPAPALQPAPTKTRRPKARTAAAIQEVETAIPSPIEEPADTPANTEEVTADAPVLATAP
jgi:cytoskeleton protein RodZ